MCNIYVVLETLNVILIDLCVVALILSQ